jgi:mono/diheme cytochrome c family protein
MQRSSLFRAVVVMLAGLTHGLTFGLAYGSEASVDYRRDVKALLDGRCISCHGALKQKGGLRLDAGALVLKGGKHGKVVKPGDAAGSALVARLVTHDEDERMPPEGKPLGEHEIAVLRTWIAAGAPVPADEDIPTGPDQHWFFKAPRKSAPPMIAGLSNPIDRFVAAERNRRKLTAQQPADPATLLRRVYLDLVGVPPSPAEVTEFVKDPSSAAYEKTVDRLLADPRHGQRWARHFMDIWRYTDEVLDPCGSGKPMFAEHHMWHWRDWIVDSLTANKPYDRMLQEMLAGDELAPDNAQAVAATGYLVRSRNDLSGRDGWLNDVVEHTSLAFLGLTVRCARCHDHKYDPIPQLSYYQMRAVFEPMANRLDPLKGFASLTTNGTPRIFDSDLGASTFLYIDGNPQQRRKNKDQQDEKLTPDVPALLKAGPLTITEVKLPAAAMRPGLLAYVRDDHLRGANELLAMCTERDAAATKATNELPALPDAETKDIPALTPTQAERLATASSLAHATAARAALLAVIAADDAANGVKPAAKPSANKPSADKPDAAALAKAAAEAQRSERRLRHDADAAQAIADGRKDAGKEPNDQAKAKFAKAQEQRRKEADEQKKPLGDYQPLMPNYPATSTGRRLAFARWVTSKQNPATARVLVNHVWLRHLGQPLVDSVFDFGLHGAKPTHPALLDTLAVDFMESQWDLRKLHRLIVTSKTYQLSSARLPGSVNETIDPENRFLWRMNSQRMQAEQVRDSILAVSGQLDLSAGGKPISPADSDRVFRRSLYFRHAQGEVDRMMAMFDAADPNECYRRGESVVPQQSLVLANSRLSFEQARLIAADLAKTANDDVAFIQAAFPRLLSRPPTTAESTLCAQFLVSRAALIADGPVLSQERSPLIAAATEPKQRAREALIQVLLNHTDFVTIR